MSKTSTQYLRDILQELDDIASFTSDGETTFMSDIKTQKAVIRSYEVVGEICKRLPADLQVTNPQIDWRKLITFRDFLAHNYELIALRYIWDAVEDLPELKSAVQAMLAGLPSDDDQS